MINIPNDIKELIHQYIKEKGERPKSFHPDEWKTLKQYKEYLKKELEK